MAVSERANEIVGSSIACAGWIELARVLRPHGLDGTLLVALHGDDPANLIEATQVALRGSPGTIPYKVVQASPTPGRAGTRARVRLSLAGITTQEAAAAWRGAALLVEPEALRPLPEGDFYWRELVGVAAIDASGRPLGRIAEILGADGGDLLVLRDGPRRALLRVLPGTITRLDRLTATAQLALDLPLVWESV